MRSKHLVDPELSPLLEGWSPTELTLEHLAKVRAANLPTGYPLEDAARSVKVEEHFAPGPGGHQVRLLVYRPVGGDAVKPGYYHMHGGAFLYGSPDQNDHDNRALAQRMDCIVASVDYRLAPETRFPGPVEDCYAGLTWFHAQASAFGLDTSRIAVGGESGGGGLAAALCLLARDRGELAICHQHLIYPMLDDRTGSVDPNPYAGEFLWTAESNIFAWKALLGREPGGDDVSPYASPARAENLAGLPPTYIAIGAIDLFVDENIAYAQRLVRAGVPTELHLYPGAYHAFQRNLGSAASKRFFRDSFDAIGRGLAIRRAKP